MTQHGIRLDRAGAGVDASERRHQRSELPGQTQTVTFSPKSDPGLDLKSPQVWWPVGMGAHPLYRFYEKVPSDPLLEPLFRKMDPAHFEHVAKFIAEVLGGQPNTHHSTVVMPR